MQDDYSLCHGDLSVMNGGTGGVCWQAGVAVGNVAGLHRGLCASTLLCAGVEAVMETGCAPRHQASNHFASYFG